MALRGRGLEVMHEPSSAGTPAQRRPQPPQERLHAEDIRAVPLRHPGRWLAVAALAVLAAMFANNLLTNPNYQWSFVVEYLLSAPILRGVGYTLVLAVGAMAVALVLGVALALMRASDNPVLTSTSWLFLMVFRGTPVYTQLVFWGLLGTLLPTIGLGIPFGPTFIEGRTYDLVTPFVAALVGLALNEAAYMAEIVRSGLLSVDPGQGEAAAALGMSNLNTMRRIVLPQAMRVIVPPTGNEFISMLKTTSLVIAVPFTLDLQSAASDIATRTFTPIPLLITAALWYLAITSVLMVGQYYLERHYDRGSNQSQPPTPLQRVRARLKGRPQDAKASAASRAQERGEAT